MCAIRNRFFDFRFLLLTDILYISEELCLLSHNLEFSTRMRKSFISFSYYYQYKLAIPYPELHCAHPPPLLSRTHIFFWLIFGFSLTHKISFCHLRPLSKDITSKDDECSFQCTSPYYYFRQRFFKRTTSTSLEESFSFL